MIKLMVLYLLLLLSAGTIAAQAPVLDGADPAVVDAVDGVLSAFETYSVVAIGEQHGIQQVGDFYQALLRHPDFAQTVDALVLEYGNARYQAVVDRYVNGEDVTPTDLERIWGDAVAKIPGGTEIMYVQLFTTIRALNQSLPEGERLRILLGDPPIDWSVVDSAEDVLPFQLQRESYFAQVVIDEVLAQGLKGLVITGAPHLDREANLLTPMMLPFPAEGMPAAPPPAPAPAQVMQQLVESEYPGQTYVIVVHTGFVEDACNAEVEARMAGWATPALATVEGTWLENIPCQKFPAPILIRVDGAGGSGAPDQSVGAAPGMVGQPNVQLPSGISSADAYLFVGTRDSLTMSPFDPIIYLDPDYFAEQSRRYEIMRGVPLDWQAIARDNPRRYVDNFPN